MSPQQSGMASGRTNRLHVERSSLEAFIHLKNLESLIVPQRELLHSPLDELHGEQTGVNRRGRIERGERGSPRERADVVRSCPCVMSTSILSLQRAKNDTSGKTFCIPNSS